MALADIDALQRFLTAQGVISFTEHDETGADGRIAAECIGYAIAYTKGRLSAKYEISLLDAAPILREWATVIAARMLCTRRGNPIPDSLEMRYQEIVGRDGLIDQVYHSHIKLIDDLGNVIQGKASFAPSMSNLRVDRRYRHETVRVVQSASTNNASKQERDTFNEWGSTPYG